jgi:peptidoglycan biosynthesis protein MviN/MurJ (putative lipid II flippase)
VHASGCDFTRTAVACRITKLLGNGQKNLQARVANLGPKSLFTKAIAPLLSSTLNLRSRLPKHPVHRVIARGIVLTLMLVLLGRAVGAAREVAIAARLGTGELVDAYVFVLIVLSWPIGVWSTVLGAVLVPHVQALRQNRSAETLAEFRANLFGLSLIAGLGCGAIFWVSFSSDAFFAWLGFPGRTLTLAHQMSLFLLPIVPIGFVSSYFSVWMMSSGRYVYTLFEAAPSLCVLIALAVFTRADIAGLVLGTLAGFLLQLILLGMCLGVDRELSLPKLRLNGSEWRLFGTNFGILGLGQALMTATVLIDQAMAAALHPGTLAILGYTGRILGVMLSIGALSINRAALPTFSQMRTAGDPRLPYVALQWAALLFIITAVAAWLIWLVSPHLVKLLFERGAFTEEDTQAVAYMLSFALVQVPFYCSGLVLTAHLAASGHYWFMTGIGAANLLLKPICNYFLIAYIGPSGIVLASGVIYAVSLAIMGIFVILQARDWTGQKAALWNRV